MKLRKILLEMLNEASFDDLKSLFVDTGKITQKTFDEIKDGLKDEHSYATWLINRIVKKDIKLEDLYKWIGEDGYLKTYIKYKNRKEISVKDISTVKKENIPAFIKSIVDIKNSIKDDPSKAGGSNKFEKYKEFYIGNVDGFAVFELPKGRTDLYGMSCDLGSGTEWCTATGKTRTNFDRYINSGPFFIFIKKGSDEKYQFGYEVNQFMDKYNEPII